MGKKLNRKPSKQRANKCNESNKQKQKIILNVCVWVCALCARENENINRIDLVFHFIFDGANRMKWARELSANHAWIVHNRKPKSKNNEKKNGKNKNENPRLINVCQH